MNMGTTSSVVTDCIVNKNEYICITRHLTGNPAIFDRQIQWSFCQAPRGHLLGGAPALCLPFGYATVTGAVASLSGLIRTSCSLSSSFILRAGM